MNMKKISYEMNVCMGITMSLFLSLIGTLTSGHFTPRGFLISFAASTVISLIIGFTIPIKKAGDAAVAKLGLPPRTLGARCIESLVSDCIYTPVITLAMVFLAYLGARQQLIAAVAQGAPEEVLQQLRFLPMFLPSLGICMVAGFVLVFIFMPLYLRLIFKVNGVPMKGGAPEA